MNQPQNYSKANHALLLKEEIILPPSDDATRQLLEIVQTIKEKQCDENNDIYHIYDIIPPKIICSISSVNTKKRS